MNLYRGDPARGVPSSSPPWGTEARGPFLAGETCLSGFPRSPKRAFAARTSLAQTWPGQGGVARAARTDAKAARATLRASAWSTMGGG